ncbi:MAG: endonuclease/exonuclease/phosphatase family protein [Acidimicrobiales bacterium]
MIRTTTARFVTWNLWLRFQNWEQRRKAIATTLERLGPDVVLLQEVWRVEDANLAQELGGILGMDHVYTHCSTNRGAGVYAAGPDGSAVDVGNAILSRWPIVDSDESALPGPVDVDSWRRCVSMAEIAGPRGHLRVFNTHLSHGYEDSALRQDQVRHIAGFIAERRHRAFPPVLAGDFNADPACDEVRMLTGRTSVPVPGLMLHDAWDMAGSGPGHTWSNENPLAVDSLAPARRIDYLLVGTPQGEGRGHPVMAQLGGVDQVDGVQPSDHYAVVVDLRY